MSTKKLSQFSTALEEEGQPLHQLLPFTIAAHDASPFHGPNLFISSNDQAATRAEFYEFSGEHQQYQKPGDLFSLQPNHYGGTSFKDQSSFDIDAVSDQGISHDSPIKWMSSKMRLMRKMLGSDQQIPMNKPRRGMQPPEDQVDDLHNPESGIGSISLSGAVVRTCSDCNTTKTPLWRSGPQGPKSLCNACGIRQMKARRAVAASSAAAPKKEIIRKEKKSDVDRTIPYKKRYKFTNPGVDHHEKLRFDHATAGLISHESSPAGFHPAFPQDEKDAAILLMTLSCGMIHT